MFKFTTSIHHWIVFVAGPVPTSPYIIAISVIAAVLLVLVIVVIILCAIKLFHPHHNPTQTSRQDFKF